MKKMTLAITAAIVCLQLSCKENVASTQQPIETPTAMEETTLDVNKNAEADFTVTPVSHASTVLDWEGTTLYVDPVGGADKYSNYNTPNIILITHIHGDHLNVETLEGLNTDKATFIMPQSVADKLPPSFTSNKTILANGEMTTIGDFSIEAIPMYNLRKEDLDKHPKGRGNGYVIENAGKRVYFSGDTEDIPEMRNLKNIDVAFVCMNLPYTMTVENAASAVLDFAPVQVYPYHYRGKNGLSDVSKFAQIVNENDEVIEVVQLDWYPEKTE